MKRLLPLILFLFVLSGCASDAQPVTRDLMAMDTVITLTAYGEKADDALDAAETEIKRLDDLFSITNESSEVTSINKNGGGELSEDAAEVMKTALEVSKRTGGAFDVSIEPVVEAWGFISGNYRVPSDEELAELLKNVGWERIGLVGNTLTLPEGMSINLGGIAKGYTGQRLADMFVEMGVKSAIVSLGGNVQAVGTKPDGSDWRVGIQDPDDSSANIGILSVSNCAVVTSGGYQRFFVQDGVTYQHIIDPSTGKPATSGLKSVTIICSNGTLADGLSKLYVMGLDKAIAVWRASDDFECVLVTDDDTVYVTEGLKYESSNPWQVVKR